MNKITRLFTDPQYFDLDCIRLDTYLDTAIAMRESYGDYATERMYLYGSENVKLGSEGILADIWEAIANFFKAIIEHISNLFGGDTSASSSKSTVAEAEKKVAATAQAIDEAPKTTTQYIIRQLPSKETVTQLQKTIKEADFTGFIATTKITESIDQLLSGLTEAINSPRYGGRFGAELLTKLTTIYKTTQDAISQYYNTDKGKNIARAGIHLQKTKITYTRPSIVTLPKTTLSAEEASAYTANLQSCIHTVNEQIDLKISKYVSLCTEYSTKSLKKINELSRASDKDDKTTKATLKVFKAIQALMQLFYTQLTAVTACYHDLAQLTKSWSVKLNIAITRKTTN